MSTTTAAGTTATKPRGAFIVFEGIDRCGKTTQCKALEEYISSRSERADGLKSSAFFRFPNRESQIGKLINDYLATTAKTDINDNTIHLLFSANRWEQKDIIEKTLESGVSIVCDRYAYSGVAFSSAKGMDLDWCKSCDRGLPAPDCVLYLDMPVENAAKRGDFGAERYEKVDFQLKVREKFMQLKSEDDSLATSTKWYAINADRTIAEVSAEIQSIVCPVLDACEQGKPVNRIWS